LLRQCALPPRLHIPRAPRAFISSCQIDDTRLPSNHVGCCSRGWLQVLSAGVAMRDAPHQLRIVMRRDAQMARTGVQCIWISVTGRGTGWHGGQRGRGSGWHRAAGWQRRPPQLAASQTAAVLRSV